MRAEKTSGVLSYDASPIFSPFSCLASASLVLRSIPLRPFFKIYSPECVERLYEKWFLESISLL
jgi:hypothetical protein